MELKVVGKDIQRVDALEKVRGKAKFCSDFIIPGMLYGMVLRSPHPHAKIISIDTCESEKVPGVRAVVTGRDAPDRRNGLMLMDQYVLCKDNIVRSVGEAVAAVAADSIESAEDALKLIDVHYEKLPAVFDPEEAMKKDPPIIIHPGLPQYTFVGIRLKLDPEMPNVCYHFKIREGNIEKGWQEADLIIENRFSVARIQHCQLETNRADAWIEADGTVVVRSPLQTPASCARELASLFGFPLSKVRVMTPYVGGGFGGKSGPCTIEPIAMLLAMKSGKPVRLVLSREEQFIDSRQRIGVITYIRDGVKRDGTLIAREMKVIVDSGRHAGSALLPTRNLAFGAVGTYRVPNFKLDSYTVYTSNPVTGAYRGFGSPEVTWAIEQQMDMIAEKLGIDAVQLRKKNILREGERDVCGQITYGIGVKECLDRVTEWIEWNKKSEEVEGPWRKGKGIAIGNKYTMGGFSSAATVKVYPDGLVEVRHGASEMGQGLNTVVAQIAAEEFGVSVNRVRVRWGDTFLCPYDLGGVSSRLTFHTGNAVRRACQDAKRQLFEIASGILRVNIADLETKAGNIYVVGLPNRRLKITDLFNWEGVPIKGGEILGTGSYHGPAVAEDPETGQSERMVVYYAHMAVAVEVAVNVETGEVKILRITGAVDPTPINPKMVEGQIEGGMAQAIGSAIWEEIVLNEGVVVNPNFMDYKIPTSLDLPSNKNTKTMIVPLPHAEGPFGAKGVGELTMVPVAPAIANAVYNAVGIRIMDLPISRQKVLDAIRGGK